MSIWCFTNRSEQSWSFVGFVLWIGIANANSNQITCWGWEILIILEIDRVTFQHGGSKGRCVGNAMQLQWDGSSMSMFVWTKDFYKKLGATRSLINVYI
jgi:hypothetical protein